MYSKGVIEVNMPTIITVKAISDSTNDIVDLVIKYMGLSDPVAFVESGIASFVVAMMSDKAIMETGVMDVLDACDRVYKLYPDINANLLSAEIMDRIIIRRDNKYLNTSTHELLSRVLIGVGAFVIYHLFIRK